MVTFQVLRGAGAMGWTGECDPTTCWTTAVGCVGFYSLVLLGSRFVFSPAIAPVTYQRLGKQPGQQGYWDSSFASTVNGVINTILVVWVVARDPRLLTLSDAFVSTDDSCKMVVLFMTWCIFDLAQVLYYYKHWEGMAATLVHHISAIVAWMLYLEGGYGHSLSLLGVFCEATNPFMNLRYFLSTAGMKTSKLYMINGLAFCLSWLLVRILFAIPVGIYTIAVQWDQLLARGLPLWRCSLFAGFFCVGAMLNMMWGHKLFMGALKILTAKSA